MSVLLALYIVNKFSPEIANLIAVGLLGLCLGLLLRGGKD